MAHQLVIFSTRAIQGIYDRPWLSGIPNARETQGAWLPAHLGAILLQRRTFQKRCWHFGKCFFGLQSFHHVFFFDLQAWFFGFGRNMTFAPENWARRHSMARAERLHIAGHRASFVSVQRHTGYHWIRACFYSWKVRNSNKKFCSTN